MTSILDNVTHLPKGLPIRIEESTYIQKGILSHQWGDLYMQSSDGQVRHIRHAWNSFLKHTQTPDAEVLKNLPLENLLDHVFLDKEGGKVSLAQILTWPVERIKGLGLEATPEATCPVPVATCPPPVATATCPPPDAIASTDQPCPEIPEEFKRLERIHLSSLLDSTMTVRMEVGTRGVLKAELHPDGTFSYDDGEVEFMGLDSFELLWYYRRRFPQENDSLANLDYEMALGFIQFHSDTRPLLDRVKEFYADMPPLVPIADGSTMAEPNPEDPDPLCLFMARLEDKEAIYRRELRILTAIEEKQRVVKDLEAQVALMRTKVGI
jgi:hypothetical protein